jgi:hypothetical protein
MTCTGRWASAWAYASFWCVGSMALGLDDSGLLAQANLSDSQADFEDAGFKPNKGMILYNTTQSTSGPITAVTPTTMTATGVTWDTTDGYRAVSISGAEIATIEHYLNVTAGNIFAVLASVGACDCTLASWASSGNQDGADFLGKLNIIEAGAYHTCRCGMPGQRMTPEERTHWLTQSNLQLDAIRTGKIDPCDGATGSAYPSAGWAEQSLTVFNAARIIANRIARTST